MKLIAVCAKFVAPQPLDRWGTLRLPRRGGGALLRQMARVRPFTRTCTSHENQPIGIYPRTVCRRCLCVLCRPTARFVPAMASFACRLTRVGAAQARAFSSSSRVVKPSPPLLEHKFDMNMYTGPSNKTSSSVRNSTRTDSLHIADVKCVDSEALFRSAQANPAKKSYNNPLLSVP